MHVTSIIFHSPIFHSITIYQWMSLCDYKYYLNWAMSSLKESRGWNKSSRTTILLENANPGKCEWERRMRQIGADELIIRCFMELLSSATGCWILEDPTYSLPKWKVSLGQEKGKSSTLHLSNICSAECKFLALSPLFLPSSHLNF